MSRDRHVPDERNLSPERLEARREFLMQQIANERSSTATVHHGPIHTPRLKPLGIAAAAVFLVTAGLIGGVTLTGKSGSNSPVTSQSALTVVAASATKLESLKSAKWESSIKKADGTELAESQGQENFSAAQSSEMGTDFDGSKKTVTYTIRDGNHGYQKTVGPDGSLPKVWNNYTIGSQEYDDFDSLVDPTKLSHWVKAARGETVVVGKEQLRGVQVTHYKTQFDFDAALPSAQGDEEKQLLTGFAQDAGNKPLPGEVWVDNDGFIRKIFLPNAMPAVGLEGIAVTVELYDFDQPVTITIPARTELSGDFPDGDFSKGERFEGKGTPIN